MPDLAHLGVNDLSSEGTAWLIDLLERIETLDIDTYAKAMADDVEIVLANGAVTLRGKAAVVEAFGQPWQELASLVHTELAVCGTDLRFAHESAVSFRALDGREWTSRSTAWIERDIAGRLLRARIYGDA